jgi:hypothetical protein
MSEKETTKESMKFIEKKLTGNEPPRCVDGRPDQKSPQGPQMLGGSLHPLVMNAIITNRDFDALAVENGLRELREANFPIGVHRGHHKDAELKTSDCGFGDKLKMIIFTARHEKLEIVERLMKIYKKEGIDTNTLLTSYNLISNYDRTRIKITGEDLIQKSEENGAAIENLDGNHMEQAAFVNLKINTTLDTQNVNKQGKQAFNLDLWAAIEQGLVLTKTADVETLRDLSLILYMATEMVLVEQKDNKPPLPIILHK